MADMFAANEHGFMVVMNRLSVLLRFGYKSVQEVEQPLLGLARGIDFSVANGDIPSKATELYSLVKQICLRKDDDLLLPLIMVLMISIKNACKLGWFSDADTKEIIDLYKEISSSFCLPPDIDDELSLSTPHVQTLMDRFFPRFSVRNILACLEVKPGYGAHLVDFHMSKNAGFLPQEKIRLFVAQTDYTETSSCLISPQQANFLLNGKGVAGRVHATMDTGPQIPTDVTAILKFGTNLLQVLGHFSGNYVIAIAFMGVIPLSTPNLKDYVQLDVISRSSDSDVLVGPSRITLNCPISRTRIKTPVKGHLCKHVQCFDFDNFVEINSRRPSWRCPHCNQYISFLDIRVDQNMVKVLNEVADNVEDVIISPDGSWKNTPKSNDDASGDTNINHLRESDAPDILDLTMEGGEMDAYQFSDVEDRKLSVEDLLNSMGSSVEMHTELNTSNQANQSTVSRMDDDFWSGLDLSSYNSGPSGDGFDNQFTTNTYHPTGHAPGSSTQLSSLGATNVSVQQSQLVNSVIDNQYACLSSVPPKITRTPTEVQAPAATSGTLNSILTSSATPASLIASGTSSQGSPSMALNADVSMSTISEVERLREYSRSVLKRLQLPEMISYPSQQRSVAQSRDAMRSINHNSSTRTAASVSTSQFSNRMAAVHQNRPHQQQPQFISHPNLSVGMMQNAHLSRTNYQQANSSNVGNISLRSAFQPVREPSRAYQNQTLRSGQSFSAGAPGTSVQHPLGGENLVNLSADPNVRPVSRMRGSLSGHAYEDAFNRFMCPSVQPTRTSRPPMDLTSPPPGVPPELHEMVTNLSVPDSSVPKSGHC
ncbi:unnamed protein product [Rhodiola kirilowii]